MCVAQLVGDVCIPACTHGWFADVDWMVKSQDSLTASTWSPSKMKPYIINEKPSRSVRSLVDARRGHPCSGVAGQR